MKILVLNGPNLNFLGIREPELYGKGTYSDLVSFIDRAAADAGVQVEVLQSNHEGELVGWVQQAYGRVDGIVLNAAAYTHTSVALLDALKAVGLPCVEVHLTDVNRREPFRRFSYVSLYAEKTICGKGFEGYREAIFYLKERG